MSLKDTFPLRVMVGGQDLTAFVDDGATFANVDNAGTGVSGFESCSLPFPMDLPQVLRGDYIRIDCGLGVAWEGRVKQVQRSLGSRTLVQGEGYSASLGDQATSMVFVDRDLTRWTDPSAARQLSLVGANNQLGSAQVAADPTSANPAIVTAITDSWVSPFKPIVEEWYDAGPQNLIQQIFYDFKPGAAVGTGAWQAFVAASSDANGSSTSGSTNLASSGLEVSAYFTPTARLRFAFLEFLFNSTPAGSAGDQFNAYWQSMTVYGNHGLTGRGGDPVGFYPSDIAGWAAGQDTSIQPGTISLTDASGFIVPHSVYYDPVTLDQIISDMATVGGWHWGVWESPAPLTGDPRPRFDFRPRPAAGAFTAFCLRKDCDTLDLTEDLSQQYNECVVQFSNVDGTDGVAIVTADNPILDTAGIPGRTLVLTGGTMVQSSAAVFAAEALAITNAQARVSGSADIITAINGGTRAPWMLRSGIDRLRIGDVPSTDAFGAASDFPISRVECTLSTSGWSTSVELGSGADLVETLQARLTAASALAAQGG